MTATEPISHREIVIIGGGVAGASAAYHLSKLGKRDILLLERHHVAALPGSDFGEEPAALTLRLSTSFLHDLAQATVDEVLDAARQPDDEGLLRRVCPDVLEVCGVLDRFVESLGERAPEEKTR